MKLRIVLSIITFVNFASGMQCQVSSLQDWTSQVQTLNTQINNLNTQIQNALKAQNAASASSLQPQLKTLTQRLTCLQNNRPIQQVKVHPKVQAKINTRVQNKILSKSMSAAQRAHITAALQKMGLK